MVPGYTLLACSVQHTPHSADDQVIVMTTINIMHCSTAATLGGSNNTPAGELDKTAVQNAEDYKCFVSL